MSCLLSFRGRPCFFFTSRKQLTAGLWSYNNTKFTPRTSGEKCPGRSRGQRPGCSGRGEGVGQGGVGGRARRTHAAS